MQNLVSIFLLILLTLPSVMAADFQKGVKAANNGDFVMALKEFRPLAEQGQKITRKQFTGIERLLNRELQEHSSNLEQCTQSVKRHKMQVLLHSKNP